MKIPKKLPFWKGAGAFILLRKLLIVIAIISFIYGSVQVAQDTGQWEMGVKNLLSKMYNPLQELADHTLNLKEYGFLGQYDNFLQAIGNWFVNLWGLIEPFIGAYFGFFLIRKLVGIFTSSTNPPFVIYGASALIYILFMEIWIGFFTPLGETMGLSAPFELIKQVFENLFATFG